MTCNRICDVANDGICMGVCAMGLSTSGYEVAENGANVYLLHESLNGALIQISKNESGKIAQLAEFVKHQKSKN